ncbi:MAG TPA: hypothetical protein VMS17_12210 [Gemmataceae bacterium]|nr:hypothetical protein [Gemmataceae bacterium]
MNLYLVPEQQGKYQAFMSWLQGQLAPFVRQSASVCGAMISTAGTDRDGLLKRLQGGMPPFIMVMHQQMLGHGANPDWIVDLNGTGQFAVLGELVDCWEQTQNTFFTRQVTSVILMGVIQTIQNDLGTLRVGDTNVYFDAIPYHLKAFAEDAFKPLGWSRNEYIPDRGVLAQHGCSIP